MDLLDPFEVDDGHHADAEIDVLGDVDIVGFHQAVQAFIEQHVGAGRHVFPRGEFTGVEAGVEALVVFGSFFVAVDVVALLAASGLAVGLEQFGQLVEVVGLRTEMAERHVALGFGLLHRFLEFDARQAVEAVTLDHGSVDFFAKEDVLECALDGGGAGAG